jgi:hypothetical protein
MLGSPQAALPPNSSDSFFTVPTHCCISNLPLPQSIR